MAEPARTLRVTGLPTDIEEDRLKDKLLIHFMRTRNGGGEVDSVTIDTATPISALITYEDREVAQRVIQHGRHILEVDGKRYKLTVTEHCERPHPDKVILRLSATVDYRQLPGGIQAVTSLQERHPDVQIRYTTEQCTLNGNYSKVQAALAQLIDQPRSPQSAGSKDSDQPAPIAPRSVQTTHYSQESEYQSRKHHKQRHKQMLDPASDEYKSGSHRDLTPTGYGREDPAQTLSSVLQVSEDPTTSEEDFSLMVDADVFQYLQKHCQKEYQHILKKHGVEVVELTNQGLTTLFLQIAKAGREGGPALERLKLSRKAISTLCQNNESKIYRGQLLKSMLSPRGGLQRALENLSVKFPHLLLKEDEINIYIIGNSSDVSEARQCLLLDSGKRRGAKDDVASLLRHDSSSLNPAGEERAPFNMSPTEETLDDRVNDILRSGQDEKRDEVAKKYKLAARFKDSGLAALGNRPTDYTLRGHSSSSRQMSFGPMLGHDVLSGTTERSGEGASRSLALNTGKDILFKSGSHLLSNFIEPQPKSSTSPLSTTQSRLSGSAALSPAGPGSTLRRASSFSGTPQQKAQLLERKSKDDSSKSTVSSKSRSLTFSTTERHVHHVDIRVSSDLWKHVKEAYSFRLDDLTSDVQVKESHSESGELTVTLRGASAAIVSSCHLALQRLIESVSADFSVKVLLLSELGVTDSADETLLACCTEVCSRFKKVTISLSKESLCLLGPELLCSQVAATLQEVFSGDLSQIPEQQTFSNPIASYTPSSFSQTNENQISSLHCNSNPQVIPESKTGTAAQTGGGQKWRASHRSDFSETDLLNGSVRKDPVTKEKVKMTSVFECGGQTTDTVVNYLTAGYDKGEVKHANDVRSTTGRTDKDVALQNKRRTAHSSPNESMEKTQADIQEIPEESRSSQGHLDCICVCGQKVSPIMRTECGAALCSECLVTIHARCRVCHETVPTPLGIRGKMSSSSLQMSIPGHKDSAIKLIYNIPDGIQGETHPCPGKPFQGGVFEAYLPDCDTARKLLPRLRTAFKQGLTFTVADKGTAAKVTWGCIPHKTSVLGGKSGFGYPDGTYLSRLSQVLTSHGIK